MPSQRIQADYNETSLQSLIKRGGRRLQTDLEMEANTALLAMALTNNGSQREIVNRAIIELYKSISPTAKTKAPS